MVVHNVPSPKDFINSGLGFLNLAWDMICAPHYYLDNAGIFTLGEKESKAYWTAYLNEMKTTLVLIHQAIEFVLKGNIATISPYLLIINKPKDYPKLNNKHFVNFADFNTIDSHDLPKIYNTFCEKQLDDKFRNHYERLRKFRNSVIHTVDPNLNITIKELFILILETYTLLRLDEKWVENRINYINTNVYNYAEEPDSGNYRLYYEFKFAERYLSAKQKEKYFGFTKARRYICSNCLNDAFCNEFPFSAQLEPNTKDSTNLVCRLCNENIRVIRKKCSSLSCKSNVLFEDNTCAICFEKAKS